MQQYRNVLYFLLRIKIMFDIEFHVEIAMGYTWWIALPRKLLGRHPMCEIDYTNRNELRDF